MRVPARASARCRSVACSPKPCCASATRTRCPPCLWSERHPPLTVSTPAWSRAGLLRSGKMQLEFNAQSRTLQGTGASRRLRKAGRVPGVVYGGDKAAEAIDIDHNEIWHKLRNEAFHASVLTIIMADAKQQVLLRDIQMHPFKRQILHLD